MTKHHSRHPGKKNSAHTDHAALVRAAAAGGHDALEQLLMWAQEVAYRFGLTVCGHTEDAEDVMQDALLKTYQHVGRIREPDAFRTWLYRTVRSACLMRRRRRVDEPAQMLSHDELLPSPGGAQPAISVPARDRGPEDAVSNARLGRQLRRALRRLPAHFRIVVFLREMEELSTREVADVLGISEANVKTRLHRAHLFLRKELRP